MNKCCNPFERESKMTADSQEPVNQLCARVSSLRLIRCTTDEPVLTNHLFVTRSLTTGWIWTTNAAQEPRFQFTREGYPNNSQSTSLQWKLIVANIDEFLSGEKCLSVLLLTVECMNNKWVRVVMISRAECGGKWTNQWGSKVSFPGATIFLTNF